MLNDEKNMLKVNNKNSRKTSTDIVLVSPL